MITINDQYGLDYAASMIQSASQFSTFPQLLIFLKLFLEVSLTSSRNSCAGLLEHASSCQSDLKPLSCPHKYQARLSPNLKGQAALLILPELPY